MPSPKNFDIDCYGHHYPSIWSSFLWDVQKIQEDWQFRLFQVHTLPFNPVLSLQGLLHFLYEVDTVESFWIFKTLTFPPQTTSLEWFFSKIQNLNDFCCKNISKMFCENAPAFLPTSSNFKLLMWDSILQPFLRVQRKSVGIST